MIGMVVSMDEASKAKKHQISGQKGRKTYHGPKYMLAIVYFGLGEEELLGGAG